MNKIYALSLLSCSILFSSVQALKADELGDAIGELSSSELSELSALPDSDILVLLGLGVGVGEPCGGVAPPTGQCGGTCENAPGTRPEDVQVCTVSPGTGSSGVKECQCLRTEQVKCGSYSASLGCSYGVCEAGKTCQASGSSCGCVATPPPTTPKPSTGQQGGQSGGQTGGQTGGQSGGQTGQQGQTGQGQTQPPGSKPGQSSGSIIDEAADAAKTVKKGIDIWRVIRGIGDLF